MAPMQTLMQACGTPEASRLQRMPRGNAKMHVSYLASRGTFSASLRNAQTFIYICTQGAVAISGSEFSCILNASDACVIAPGVAYRIQHDDDISLVRIDIDLTSPERRRQVHESPCNKTPRGLGGALPGSTAGAGDMGMEACSLDNAAASAPFAGLDHGFGYMPGFYDESQERLVNLIHQELNGPGTRHRMALQGMAEDLLLEVSCALDKRNKRLLSPAQIVSYIDEHYATTSLADTAAHFFCHPNTISNLLQKQGLSFLEVLTDARMTQAAMMLRQDGVPMQGVAFACGYTSVSHFYDVFRKRYGMTPGKYRQMIKHKQGNDPRVLGEVGVA